MTLELIILQSLNYGFDHYNDLNNIITSCVKHDESAFKMYHWPKYNELYDDRPQMHDVIKTLHLLIKYGYVNKISRGIYNINEKGKLYLKTESKYHNFDDIIKNTEKESDALSKGIEKEVSSHPMKRKFLQTNGKLKEEILNKLDVLQCGFIYNIDDRGLHIITMTDYHTIPLIVLESTDIFLETLGPMIDC